MTAMRRIAVIFALTIVPATTGMAQGSAGLQLMVGSGIALPAAPMVFAEYWTMQMGGAVGVGYPISGSTTIFGSVEYYRFSLDVERVRSRFDNDRLRRIWVLDAVSVSPSSGASSMMTIAAGFRTSTSSPNALVRPYALLAGGWMRFSLREIALPTTSQLTIGSSVVTMTAEQAITGGIESVPFVESGVGVTVPLSAFVQPYVEARYVLGFTIGARTAYVPLTLGVIIEW